MKPNSISSDIYASNAEPPDDGSGGGNGNDGDNNVGLLTRTKAKTKKAAKTKTAAKKNPTTTGSTVVLLALEKMTSKSSTNIHLQPVWASAKFM